MTKDVRKRLEKGLESLPEFWAVMVETEAGKTDDVSSTAIEMMAEEGTVVIVTATKPAITVKKKLEEQGIDPEEYYIIDCVSRSQQKSEDTDNITYLRSVTSLTDISIKVSEQLKAIKEDGDKPFLYLDSVNSLLMHNNPRTVARFIHGLLTRIRLNEVSAMLLSVEASIDPQVRAEVAQLSDGVISV